MTARTITEIRDVAADGDTITTIRVGPEPRVGHVEFVVEQWSSGFRGETKPLSVYLEPDDARALIAALRRSRCRAFLGGFALWSERTLITGGFRFVVSDSGWTSSPTLRVFAIDLTGDEV